MAADRKQQYVLYLTLFQVLVGFGVIIPILPSFVTELGGTSVHMGLMVTVWAGAQFLFASTWGALSDRIGRRPVLLIGLAGYALTFGLLGLATSMWTALLFRFLGGVLSAATIPTAQAYIADTTVGEARTQKMAAMSAAMNIGFIAGPALGGLLASAGLNYRETFWVAAGLALFTWLLAFTMLPEPHHRRTAASGATGASSLSGLRSLPVALRGPESILYLLAFAATFGGSAMFSMLGFFLKQRFGLGNDMLGLAFSLQGVAAVSFQALLAAILTRRFKDESLVLWGLLSGAAGFLILILSRNFLEVLAGLVVLTYGTAVIRPVITAMVSRRTHLEQGVTMGIQNSFDALGRAIGPIFAGAVMLWQDWAPFAVGMAAYLAFWLWAQAAWRSTGTKPEARTV